MNYYSYCQIKGTLLVLSDSDSKLNIDGEDRGNVLANILLEISLNAGEHLLKFISNEIEKEQIVTVEKEQQKIVQIAFKAIPTTILEVASEEFKTRGMKHVQDWRTQNPGKKYTTYPTFHYVFDKNDHILIDLNLNNSVYACTLSVNKYPENTPVYTEKMISGLKDFKLKLTEKGIYKFTIVSDSYHDGKGTIKISRIPEKTENKSFTSNVLKIHTLATEVIKIPEIIQIKSKILLPILLPKNTVEWFCKYAFYDAKTENSKSEFKLATELSLLITNQTVANEKTASSITAEQLSKMKGNAIGQLYVLDKPNATLFESKQAKFEYIQLSETNSLAGNIKTLGKDNKTFFLGFENPSPKSPLFATIEITAITTTEKFEISK